MEHLINTLEELNSLGRPMGKIQPERMVALIGEAEQLFLKPQLTDDLWLKVIDDNNATLYTTLINGGVWTDKRTNTQKYCNGLKKALAYFVYAQNLMAGDAQSTRYGMVVKNDDYSSHITDKERSQAYNNALEVGNAYLHECVEYARMMQFLTTGNRASSGAIKIRKIQ